MIKFEEALNTVLDNAQHLPTEATLLESSYGRVIATDILADRDMPPFDKSAVDGYALKQEDLGKRLLVLENIAAGYTPQKVVVPGTCSKIMTGAMMPQGADFIVMVEDTTENEGFMELNAGSDKLKLRNNVCYRGEDIKKGDVLLRKGKVISAAETAILASAGYSDVVVSRVPVIGILSTGDEIVEPGIAPSPSQIRNSNGWQLRAQALSTCSEVNYYGIIGDHPGHLEEAIARATSECDITIITGGVSAGDFDYVPGIIRKCGFKILFDKVAVQPGKPSTFAVKKADSKGNTVSNAIFALPGNPVSSLIQFEMLVKPYIIKSMGGSYSPLRLSLKAAQEFKRRNTDRLSLIPVVINPDGTFSPVRYNGSAHIAAMTDADAIAEIPAGIGKIAEGEETTVHIFR